MKDARILLADNDPDFLVIGAEFLERAGYQVVTTNSSQQAGHILEARRIHLAILDLRLTQDDDTKDKSGLALAKEVARAVPKVILTKFPTVPDVREALKLDASATAAAIDFLDKADGMEKLVATVNQIFEQQVRLNWELGIQFNAAHPLTFVHLVNLIAPGLAGEQLLDRAEELKDMFRQIFYEQDEIKIDRLLWQRRDRIAASVFAFAAGKAAESLIVVRGQEAAITGEARRYQDYAPKAPRATATMEDRRGATTHFAARTYTLAGAQLETVRSLRDLYQTGPEKSFNAVLKSLYEETLADWSQERRLLAEDQSLAELYRARLDLAPEQMSSAAFEDRVQTVVRQAPTLGLNIERQADSLTWRLGGQSFSYPDPTPFIYRNLLGEHTALLCNTPGALTGDNILTDHNERVWLTDFAEAGLAPLLWNFVTLEAAIRFDWVETDKLVWLHDLEQSLVEGDFNRLDASDVEALLRKPLRAIQTIRRLAARTVGNEPAPYQLGMLFQAARRLADGNPAARLMPSELARLAHALIAAAMICGQLAQGQQTNAAPVAAGGTGLWIDSENYRVWIDSRHVPLARQGYELLHYLYEHANQVRTRRDIVEEVFRQKYDEADESQTRRLNTAIRRLRERIEPDPERPRYLLTEPGRGYRLVC
jgi:DNA-binding response OmpR family regulator